MNRRVVITLRAAAEDLDAGKAFYDASEPGIGLYFVDSLVSEIESLQSVCGVHGQVYGFFRMLCQRFPFAIYYDIQGNTVRVAAILGMSATPWRVARNKRKVAGVRDLRRRRESSPGDSSPDGDGETSTHSRRLQATR